MAAPSEMATSLGAMRRTGPYFLCRADIVLHSIPLQVSLQSHNGVTRDERPGNVSGWVAVEFEEPRKDEY